MTFLSFLFLFFFFFNDPSTTEIYTLSLHDALPIWNLDLKSANFNPCAVLMTTTRAPAGIAPDLDRKSTRLNSSHTVISYAVFCLKKKKKNKRDNYTKRLTTTESSWLEY